MGIYVSFTYVFELRKFPKMKSCTFLLSLSVITFQNFAIYLCQLHDEIETWRRIRLPAVAAYEGVEDLFSEMHKSRLKSYKDEKNPASVRSEGVKQLDLDRDNLHIKRDICRYIVNSDYFKSKSLEPVDPVGWGMRGEIKKNNAEIYSDLFKPTDRKAFIGGTDDGYARDYENPFKIRDISVKKETEKAHVFSCVVRKLEYRVEIVPPKPAVVVEEKKKDDKAEKAKAAPKKDDKGKGKAKEGDKAGTSAPKPPPVEQPPREIITSYYVYKQYFVSEDYNMSAATSKGAYARPIAGRFIFVPNEEKKLVVHAVTRESTRSLAAKRNTAVEYIYLEKKLTHSPAGKAEEDPMCIMKVPERFRLCAAIFTMREFDHKYRFLSTASVGTECEKRRVSYRSSTVRGKVGGKTIFQEWMFSCRPQKIGNVVTNKLFGREQLGSRTFYVSRGYVNDKVFLYRERRGRIYPEWYLYGTGIVDEVPKPVKKEEKKVEPNEPKMEYLPDGAWSYPQPPHPYYSSGGFFDSYLPSTSYFPLPKK